eukprot:731143-Rhodomonas_salina.2
MGFPDDGEDLASFSLQRCWNLVFDFPVEQLPITLPAPYALSGTDIAYGAAIRYPLSPCRTSQSFSSPFPYYPLMPCPVQKDDGAVGTVQIGGQFATNLRVSDSQCLTSLAYVSTNAALCGRTREHSWTSWHKNGRTRGTRRTHTWY